MQRMLLSALMLLAPTAALANQVDTALSDADALQCSLEDLKTDAHYLAVDASTQGRYYDAKTLSDLAQSANLVEQGIENSVVAPLLRRVPVNTVKAYLSRLEPQFQSLNRDARALSYAPGYIWDELNRVQQLKAWLQYDLGGDGRDRPGRDDGRGSAVRQ